MGRKAVLAAVLLAILSATIAYIIVMKGVHFAVARNVAVSKVIVPKTDVYVGEVIDIIVTVKNKGGVHESFNVTLYYNLTAVRTEAVINLAPGAEANVTFSWNTAGLPPANYEIRAEASVVKDEVETLDNALSGGVVSVRAKLVILYVDPPIITAKVGQSFTVNVSISDVVNLCGWEFELTWDPAVLNVTNIVEGPFLKLGGATIFLLPFGIDNVAGRALVACALLAIRGVNGNGTLVTVEFYVKSHGESALNLHDTKLASCLVEPIKHVDKGGYFKPQ